MTHPKVVSPDTACTILHKERRFWSSQKPVVPKDAKKQLSANSVGTDALNVLES